MLSRPRRGGDINGKHKSQGLYHTLVSAVLSSWGIDIRQASMVAANNVRHGYYQPDEPNENQRIAKNEDMSVDFPTRISDMAVHTHREVRLHERDGRGGFTGAFSSHLLAKGISIRSCSGGVAL